MDANNPMTSRFEEHRAHLRTVAYRMLGSVPEAEDAVQEAWQRFARTDTGDVENLRGWLTTVTARVCLNALRRRRTRAEEPLDHHVPDPVVTLTGGGGLDPEHEAVLADSVSLAMLVVLESLPPAERLAFVLHDMFAMPFDEIAAIVDRSPAAARQLASRGRRRVQAAPVTPDRDLERQRRAVDAFFAAAHDGDFDALVSVLDPDVVLRSDAGPLRPEGSLVVRGATTVAGRALLFASVGRLVQPAVVNGAAGVVVSVDGQAVSVMGFTVVDDTIVAIDVVADPERLATLPMG